MRQRVISAAAAFSGSLAVLCLATALVRGEPTPVLGFIAGAAAAAALVQGARRGSREQALLRLCPRGAVWVACGVGEAELRAVGITPHLICLARGGHGAQTRAVWRDSVSPDGFRRIAAYGLWRRGALPDRAESFELIAPEAVRGEQSVARTGRPRDR
jgi:hypothetical protein